MHPDPPKQLETIKIKKSNQIQQAKFTKYSYIYPNPPQPAKSLQSSKIYPDQSKSIKSNRIYANQPESS